MLKVEIPTNKTKLQKQIKALEYLIQQDTSKKDKQIHEQALLSLRKALSN